MKNTIKTNTNINCKYVPVKARWKILKIDFTEPILKENKTIPKFVAKLLPKSKPEIPLLTELLAIKTDYFSNERNDIRRILLSTPNIPEPLLVQVIKSCLEYPTFNGESDKRLLTDCLQTMHEIWDKFGYMAHVFLGTCMLASDRTVTNIAGEIWLKSVTIGKISNEQLGKVIGLHESIEFAPLKRFTDLVSQNLLNFSNEMPETSEDEILYSWMLEKCRELKLQEKLN